MNSNSVLLKIDYLIRNSPYKKARGSGNIRLSDNSVRSYKSLRTVWNEFENHIGGTVHLTELNKDILQQFIHWMNPKILSQLSRSIIETTKINL